MVPNLLVWDYFFARNRWSQENDLFAKRDIIWLVFGKIGDFFTIRIIIRGVFVDFWIGLSQVMKNMPERESISNFLKNYRQKNQETQYEFAANTGICVEELSKLERIIGNPSLETLQKIAAYTGNTVAELVYVEKDVERVQMYRMLMEEYFHSGQYEAREECECYCSLIEDWKRILSEEDYLEFEERLHELIGLMTKDAFLAGCEAAMKCKCPFCVKKE